MLPYFKIFSCLLLIFIMENAFAQDGTSINLNNKLVNNSPVDNGTATQANPDGGPIISPEPDGNQTPVERRAERENIIPPNFFAITFYKPNYILPFYYTGSPYNKVYEGNTPQNESIKSTEIKYQLSLKVPIWKNILGYPSTLHFAYTQLSYWQAYNKTAFFRETDYEPEVFLANEINWHFNRSWNWSINFLNIGAVHESNGFGSELERSWNRIYVEAISSNDNWMISIRPWYVFHDATYNHYNPDLANYLGYGEITIAYKYGRQVFSLETHSLFEQGGRRVTGIGTWSFPITSYLKGYIQVFSGYGQSLIEYDHRTNSVGVGIALSNWI